MTMPQLIAVLKDLKGGSIGFDVFRNPETKTKGLLLQYILKNYSNEAIIPAVQRVATSFNESSFSQAVKSGAELQADEIPGKPIVKATEVSPDKAADAAQLAALIARLTGGASVNMDEVRKLVDQAFESKEAALDAKIRAVSAPTKVIIENKQTGETKDCGVQHYAFPQLLIACQARVGENRLNVWLVGPAGTGKTTAAHKIADALGLPFQTDGSLLTKYDVLGYRDAGGTYHRTAFREAFEHGGVYLADEIDAWHPPAVLALNAAMANGFARFPDGMVKRHPDCVIICAANTFGTGASAEYVGRIKQDAATLDRMVFLEWNIDEKLEMALSTNPSWTATVQKFRARLSDRKIKGHLITPRASFYGASLLAQGLSEDTVKTMVLKKGLTADQWESLNG